MLILYMIKENFKNHLFCNEQHIPHIIRLLSHHFDIYDVRPKEPSLEEIFMNTVTVEKKVT